MDSARRAAGDAERASRLGGIQSARVGVRAPLRHRRVADDEHGRDRHGVSARASGMQCYGVGPALDTEEGPRGSARTAIRNAFSRASCTSSSVSITKWCVISPVHSDSPFCHNCGVRLTGPFCAACGQKALPLSVTLHDFFHEFTHEMLHVDGRIWQTIQRLIVSPGFLTRGVPSGPPRPMDFSDPVVSDFQRRVFRAQRADRIPVWRFQRR